MAKQVEIGITSLIDESLVYNRLGDNETTVWSLLLASGYLKVVEKENKREPGSTALD